MLSIIEKFNWRYENWMQDWPLEVSHEIDVAFCLLEYPKLNDDEKFLLMEGILYALDETQGEAFDLYSQKTVELLKKDFDLHQYTIYYWTHYLDYPAESEGFTITPLMRDIWNSQFKRDSLITSIQANCLNAKDKHQLFQIIIYI